MHYNYYLFTDYFFSVIMKIDFGMNLRKTIGGWYENY